MEAIYTPPPPLHSWREPSEQTYTSNLPFLRENHLLMCWGQDIPFLPYESWSLAFPKFLSTQIFFPPDPNPMRERVECWGDYHLKHKSKEFIINAPFVTSWRMVSPRLARCHLELVTRFWSRTMEFVRARSSPTSWRSTHVRQVLRGRWPWWDRQGCFFMDPSWVEPSMDSRNRYPSWVEVSINMDVR